jgi:hypothetical protein
MHKNIDQMIAPEAITAIVIHDQGMLSLGKTGSSNYIFSKGESPISTLFSP